MHLLGIPIATLNTTTWNDQCLFLTGFHEGHAIDPVRAVQHGTAILILQSDRYSVFPPLTVFPKATATARTAPQLTPTPFSSRVFRSLRCLQASCAGLDSSTPAARPQLAVTRRPAAVHQHPPRRARPRGRRLLGHLHPARVSRSEDTALRRHCRPPEPRRWIPDRFNWWEDWLHRAAS